MKFKLFQIKDIKKNSLKMWNVWFVFLYWDIDKYRHAGISFLTEMYQLTVKVNNNHKN